MKMFSSSLYNKIQTLVFSLILISPVTLFAQQEACFTVDFVKGCNPLTVTVTDCSGSANVLYDFGDGNVTTETTFTFDSEGVKTITQTIGTPDGAKQTTQTVEVVSPTEPRFSLVACANRTIQVQIEGGIYDKYLVDYGDGNQETIFPSDTPLHTYASGNEATVTVKGLFDGGAGNCTEVSSSITLIESLEPAQLSQLQVTGGAVQLDFSLPTAIEYILEANSGSGYTELQSIAPGNATLNLSGQPIPTCYRIKVVNPCSGDIILSNELCSIDITATSADKTNTATWSQYSGAEFDFYEVLKIGETAPVGQFGNTNVTTFTDTDVECGQEYCYQVIVNTANGTSISDQVCVTTVSSSTPLSVNSFYASIEADLGVLNWQVPAGLENSTIVIEKSGDGGTSYSALTEVNGTETQFTDSSIDPSLVNCYRIRIKDDCDNESDAQISCTVVVSGEKANNDNQVTWTSFEGFTDFNYYLEVYDYEGNFVREEGAFSPFDNNFSDPAGSLEGNAQTYRIRVEDELSDGVSFSNFYRISNPDFLKVPDAFSPNNDGLNDTFQVIGTQIASFRIDIFNRWGTVIFASDDIDTSWDGTLKNSKRAPKGPYSWVIKAEDTSGVTFNEKGVLLLLR